VGSLVRAAAATAVAEPAAAGRKAVVDSVRVEAELSRAAALAVGSFAIH